MVIELAYRNLLIGGEPGAGKSVLLSNIIAHAALSHDCQLWLLDGKQVELGMWLDVAEVFIGKDIQAALEALRRLQTVMDARYDRLAAEGRRKMIRADGDFILAVVDEIAYYSATAGERRSQEDFTMLLRDLVARGRAAGVIVVAATQRPSADIIPTSLRDIFGYRCAFRCTTEVTSDIILGFGWAKEGYSAASIAPEDRGVGWLLAEGGVPRRFKGAWLDDEQIGQVVARAKWQGRRRGGAR